MGLRAPFPFVIVCTPRQKSVIMLGGSGIKSRIIEINKPIAIVAAVGDTTVAIVALGPFREIYGLSHR